jgi:hypothetical protein
MNSTEAYQIVDDMLLCATKALSNLKETCGDDPLMLELGDPHGWLTKNDVRPLLLDILAGTKPLDGPGLVNLMTIAHTLCPLIAGIAPLRLPDRDLPEPDMAWYADGVYEKV